MVRRQTDKEEQNFSVGKKRRDKTIETDYLIREDRVCPICGLVWITKGNPSEEGTQMCLERCYCELEEWEKTRKLVRED